MKQCGSRLGRSQRWQIKVQCGHQEDSNDHWNDGLRETAVLCRVTQVIKDLNQEGSKQTDLGNLTEDLHKGNTKIRGIKEKDTPETDLIQITTTEETLDKINGPMGETLMTTGTVMETAMKMVPMYMDITEGMEVTVTRVTVVTVAMVTTMAM